MSRHGGARPGAGRKASWNTGPADRVIRIPAELADRVLDLARQLDEGGVVLDTIDANANAVREALAVLQEEAARLQSDRKATPRRDTISKTISALEHYQF